MPLLGIAFTSPSRLMAFWGSISLVLLLFFINKAGVRAATRWRDRQKARWKPPLGEID
jgi:hypothetical protein